MTEQITMGDYTARIIQDEDCGSPRDRDASFLWLGFPHRHYDIGDERIDPGTFSEACEACEGDGRDVTKDVDAVYEPETYKVVTWGVNAPDCTVCEGEGGIRAHNMDELIEMVKRKYKARLVVPVGMIDHSGVAYYLGGGPHWSDSAGWDSGTCGLMVATEAKLVEWGCEKFTDEELREQMTNELDEYNNWCAGDCWGYTIELSKDYEPTEDDRAAWLEAITVGGYTGSLRTWCEAKHGVDDSCWGLIGSEYAESEARSALENLTKEKETPCPSPSG